MRNRPTRRQFLRTGVAGGTALAMGLGCDAETSGHEDPVETFDDTPRGQVVLVRAEPATAVSRGLALVGGLTFIEPGQTVAIKPNFTGPLLPPDTTGPDVLAAMIRHCLDADAGEVIVAERTFGPLNTHDVVTYPLDDEFSRSMLDVIEDAGGTFLALDDEPWVEVHPAGADDFSEPLLQVMGTEPHIEDRPVWDQVQLAEAARIGGGGGGPDEITLVGEGVEEIEVIEEKLHG